MNKRTKLITSMMVAVLVLACNLPAGSPSSVEDEATPTHTPILETPTQVPPTATQCAPIITTNQDSNVRNGPGQAYNKLGYLPQGATVPVAGKNSDGTWWYIQFPSGQDGYGWISASIVAADCIPATLAVVAAPPVPVVQQNPTKQKTPKPSEQNNSNPTPTQTQQGDSPNLLFKLEFASVWYCGSSARVSAKVYNLGNVAIESVMYSVEANGLYINGGTINSSPFESSATEPEPDCAQNPGHGQSSLAPGASAYIPINISSVPAAGTQGFLYVESCTENNRKGVCTGQFVYFNF